MSVIVLTPVLAESPGDHTHLDALHHMLHGDAWRELEEDHLSHLPMLHMARFQIIEHLVPGMGDEDRPDHLASKYLLFIAEIDGRSDALFDSLYRQQPGASIGSPMPDHAGEFTREIWGHCAGYPPQQAEEIHSFRRFMQRYQVECGLPYAAVPENRMEIMRALCAKQVTAAWMALEATNGQGTSTQELARYLLALNALNIFDFSALQELYGFLFDFPEGADPPTFSEIVDKIVELAP